MDSKIFQKYEIVNKNHEVVCRINSIQQTPVHICPKCGFVELEEVE